MGSHVAQITSECGLSDQISMHPQCVLGAFTHLRCMLMPGVNRTIVHQMYTLSPAKSELCLGLHWKHPLSTLLKLFAPIHFERTTTNGETPTLGRSTNGVTSANNDLLSIWMFQLNENICWHIWPIFLLLGGWTGNRLCALHSNGGS